jgi:hypothetical protein
MNTTKQQHQHHRIWIELDRAPAGLDGAERLAFMDRQCELANSMLSKLGDMEGRKFFVTAFSAGTRLTYCFGGQMGCKQLVDHALHEAQMQLRNIKENKHGRD